MSPCAKNSLANEQRNVEKTFGLTSAISYAGPTPVDVELNKRLIETLEPHGVFDTEEKMRHRSEVLGSLHRLVRQWIREESLRKHMPQSAADAVGGNLYTFGSYRLGVHDRDADIDALCVAPRHVDRAALFTSFYKLLKSQPEVKDLSSVEDAFVPVMKMNFDGIDIDLLFARLASKEIPESLDLRDDMILKNLDQRCVRSLNGCRVTDEILRLVPHVDNFRLATRTIKLWAKRRGIYSNTLGYLGGVSWAMLVARVCQLYPNALPATIVHKFFLVYNLWTWPMPVLLQKVATTNLKFPVWDPRVNLADRSHLMPIITPAYPEQNSTFNVSLSTRSVITEEIKRGVDTMNDVAAGNCEWGRLFEATNFFTSYKHYIVLLATSNTAGEHKQWCGYFESRIRHLISTLDNNPIISRAHVNTKSYEASSSANCTMWFIGLTFEKTSLAVDLTHDIVSFTQSVHQHAMSIHVLKTGMSVEAKYVPRKQLSLYLPASLLQQEKRSSGHKRRVKEASPEVKSEPNVPVKKMKVFAVSSYNEWRSRCVYGTRANREV